MTDTLSKELDKIEALSSVSTTSGIKNKSTAIGTTLDELQAELHKAKAAVESGEDPQKVFADLNKRIEASKKQVDERQKEHNNALARFGKAVDKKFPNPLPTSQPTFSTPEDVEALERVIGMHFIRTGSFDIAQTFYNECGVPPDPRLWHAFEEMHGIRASLREGDIGPALRWATTNREFLRGRHSTLEFDLHRSHFVHLILNPPPVVSASDYPLAAAIAYSKKNFSALAPSYPQIVPQMEKLAGALAWANRLSSSPYSDLLQDSIHTNLEPAFVKEYCARLGFSRQLPLRVAGDIGGNGALAKIEKSKKVMKDKIAEWDAKDELLIEIPLPPENRYHSIFACPVSKEQSTDKNPPNMLTCGHVIAKESVNRLTKGGGRVKCPYCPVESTGPTLQVHF
ncbi:hypothetical protein FS837_005776 [Tulasnella sp. UAMH 9824]|nr:hypothetical protein FS837_005776 [Tulasnella sp. UAMH 9824]